MNETLRIEEASVADLGRALASGKLTSEQLVMIYLERIATYDRQGIKLNSVLEVNPDAIFIARALDRERELKGPRGPLHGIPVLLKDNIDTGDHLHTSAGSLALKDSFAPKDAFVAARLREAGAVILGKANMTEWANFMTKGMPSGYSSRGGQVLNPYLPGKLTPCGSSSGSGVSVAANLTAVAVGTETDGSILCPSYHNSIVGIKPTVGLVSRTGIIPIAFSQDTAGPMARTVADAAALLGAMTGIDPADPATLAAEGRFYKDYTQFLDADGLKGARIGVARGDFLKDLSEDERRLYEAALADLARLGAELVDPVGLTCPPWWESKVLAMEFKPALNAYLAALGPGAPVRTIEEVIAFNSAHAEQCLKYGQHWMEVAQATSGNLTDPEYLLDRLSDIRRARTEGIDAAMEQDGLDAIVLPNSEGSSIGARAGYPTIVVPAGYQSGGEPFGLSFLGRAWSEPILISFAYAYEQATHHRVAPKLELA